MLRLLFILFTISFSYPNSIPGPRDCFWSRGPVSKDPYINIAYPDAGVFYWHATFTIPDGAQLYLEGEFPYARYMSIISYDERGAPIESLPDYIISPNEHSINPFIEGANRHDYKRSYTVEILNLSPEVRKTEGSKINFGTKKNSLKTFIRFLKKSKLLSYRF